MQAPFGFRGQQVVAGQEQFDATSHLRNLRFHHSLVALKAYLETPVQA